MKVFWNVLVAAVPFLAGVMLGLVLLPAVGLF